jgi:hypothetical protein
MKRSVTLDLFVIGILIAFIASMSSCTNIVSKGSDFTIVYSNDVLGETEPCG